MVQTWLGQILLDVQIQIGIAELRVLEIILLI